jgi:hypothetical protein
MKKGRIKPNWFGKSFDQLRAAILVVKEYPILMHKWCIRLVNVGT